MVKVLCRLSLCFTLAACGAQTQDAVFQMKRDDMINDQIIRRGVKDAAVLDAMRVVERHRFVAEDQQELAYEDHPLPIGMGQTISQPYIVAYMTELLALKPGDRVLEIGTGCGYQAAVLAEIAGQVYSVEIVPDLAASAARRLKRLGYDNVIVRQGDGYLGWPEHAPYDAIVVTAAPPEVPQALVEQLKTGGRLVVPVGTDSQHILLITRTPGGVDTKTLIPVRFVPMVPGE